MSPVGPEGPGSPAPAPGVTEQVRVAATPERVWGLVSDVTNMGSWSPETVSCQWVGGDSGPRVGARFVGRNRNGRRSWSTTCTVVAAEPGQRFAFAVVSLGMAVAEWSFDLVPDGDGTVLSESTTDRRGWLMRLIGGAATGVRDRPEHNRAGMRATLEALRVAAEAPTD